MKTRMQIEPSERETIFAHLRKRRLFGRPPTWRTRRNGWTIRLWPVQTPIGVKIGWQMSKRLHDVHEISCTLTSAIGHINEILQPKAVSVDTLEAQSVVAPPIRREWPAPMPFEQLKLREPERLPYKD